MGFLKSKKPIRALREMEPTLHLMGASPHRPHCIELRNPIGYIYERRPSSSGYQKLLAAHG